MPHLALLGDSIFDNAAYVGGGPDVAALLRAELAGEAEVSLLARDGDVVAGVAAQLQRLPAEVTHLALSVGGNDALGQSALLERPVASVGEAVAMLAGVQRGFRAEHRHMLELVRERGLPVLVGTIYDANFEPPQGPVVATALGIFNDAISRNAISLGMDLLDLRLICSEAADYANPIEPSVQGGRKIARAIARWLRSEPTSGVPPRVFA